MQTCWNNSKSGAGTGFLQALEKSTQGVFHCIYNNLSPILTPQKFCASIELKSHIPYILIKT